MSIVNNIREYLELFDESEVPNKAPHSYPCRVTKVERNLVEGETDDPNDWFFIIKVDLEYHDINNEWSNIL